MGIWHHVRRILKYTDVFDTWFCIHRNRNARSQSCSHCCFISSTLDTCLHSLRCNIFRETSHISTYSYVSSPELFATLLKVQPRQRICAKCIECKRTCTRAQHSIAMSWRPCLPRCCRAYLRRGEIPSRHGANIPGDWDVFKRF